MQPMASGAYVVAWTGGMLDVTANIVNTIKERTMATKGRCLRGVGCESRFHR